jgi:hypothetical protein
MRRRLIPTPRHLLLGGVAIVLLGIVVRAEASGSSPGRTVSNSVTVRYEDAGGVAQKPETATATVVVTPLAVAASSPVGRTRTRRGSNGRGPASGASAAPPASASWSP